MFQPHQSKSQQKKSLLIPCPTEGGSPLFGEPARILAHGGQYTKERCTCSHKGLSCVHTFKTTLFHLYRIGWSLDDALAYSNSLAFAWAQPTEEDPFKSTADAIESHWRTLEASDYVTADRTVAWRRLQQRKHPKKSTARTFEFMAHVAVRLDSVIRRFPGKGVRWYQRKMYKLHGWRDGMTLRYLKEMRERAYLICEVAPKGFEHAYYSHSSARSLYPRTLSPAALNVGSGSLEDLVSSPMWSIATPPLHTLAEALPKHLRAGLARMLGGVWEARLGSSG